jgi:D-3-phosphoglycerate dehydrogenase
MTKTVLLSAPYILPFLDRFRPVFEHYGLEIIVAEVNERLEEEEILAYAGEFDGAICGDEGTGIDSIDLQTAEAHGVMVGNTPNAFTLPVADTVMGYILAFARRQPWMDTAMKSGNWEKLPGRSLSESTLGVVGVGNIGKAVLRRAKAFGMQLLGNDIVEISPEYIEEVGLEMTSLDDLLVRSDFISVNCDLNPTSMRLINADALAKMKPTAVLINTARGALVDESALIAALQSNKIAGAALDVFETEPLPKNSPLLQMDQVMLAPHNANSSPTAWEHVHWNTIRNLLIGLDIPVDDFDPGRFAE